MKDKVKVGLVQMDVKALNPEHNINHMCELINEAAAQNTELIVFPELANSGYVKAEDISFAKSYLSCAEKIPGLLTKTLCAKAKEHGVHIVVGMLEAHPTINYTLYNSVVLIGPQNKVLGKHQKMHLPLEERHYFGFGGDLEVFDTSLGKIGLQICYDAYFPEASRILSLRGAEIICCVFNIPRIEGRPHLEERMKHVASVRAMENMNYFLTVNRVGEDLTGGWLGGAAAAGPRGQILMLSQSDKEEIIYVTLEDELLRESRAYNSLFHDRRPEIYKFLTEPL